MFSYIFKLISVFGLVQYLTAFLRSILDNNIARRLILFFFCDDFIKNNFSYLIYSDKLI